MKNILILSVLALAFLGSCKKEEAPISNTSTINSTVRAVAIRYDIYAASGDCEIAYLVSNNGILTEKTEIITRMNHSISFESKTQQKVFIKARNTKASHDEIIISIYVDGILFQSNSTTAINSWVTVEGIPQ
jgi:hypothetical protein